MGQRSNEVKQQREIIFKEIVDAVENPLGDSKGRDWAEWSLRTL